METIWTRRLLWLGTAMFIIDIIGSAIAIYLGMPGAMTFGPPVGRHGDQAAVFHAFLVEGTAGAGPVYLIILSLICLLLVRRKDGWKTAGLVILTLQSLLAVGASPGEIPNADRFHYAGISAPVWVTWVIFNMTLRFSVAAAAVMALVGRRRQALAARL